MPLRALLLLPLCFPGLQAQTPHAEEERLEGSSLSIECPYTAYTYYHYQKAWCRLREGQWELLVEINPTQYSYTTRASKGKVTIEDNPRRGTLSITMTNLQTEDSGTYSCALRSPYEHYQLKTISLNVFKELHKMELDSLSVQCPYGKLGYSTGRKAWCQREGRTGCKVLVSTDHYPSTRSNSKALGDRAFIQDDTQNRSVTITMEKLQVEDTGVYWCALDTYRAPTRIMEVRLSVSKRSEQYTAKKLGNVSVHCPYNASAYGAVSKAWCKKGAGKTCTVLVNTKKKSSGYRMPRQQGRVTIQDDTQKGIVTVTMEQLQAEDSGVYWCALYEPSYLYELSHLYQQSHLFRMVEVTLNVSEGETPNSSPASPLTPSTFTETATSSEDETKQNSSSVKNFILLSGVLGILFILALTSLITLGVRHRKQLKRRGNRQAENTYDKPDDIAQLDSTERMESPEDDSKDLKYVTLNFNSQLSSEDPLYCNVEPRQAPRKPKDENVDYAIIALKPLPMDGQR
ncbi:PREDICTED: polymeric immunoglobulin receptor-like [Chlamydotis macqueenii]|nr:PREDICTED: polymeric immunoglobulin receptor-like [Chlamydotis macqueenii]